ncbi:MAG TPA: hypothetical protein VNT79_13835 [Phycisphaerae bacterium]|nr:hypothetical protein [Phycisphaerae bacterium]
MRSVPTMGWIWLSLGAVLFVLGGLAAAFPRTMEHRRLRAPRAPQSPVPQDDAERTREPEEQLY